MLDPNKVEEWTKRRLSMDSGFYAGRGPTTSDLNSPLLEEIYAGIKKDVSAEAASNFVRFVNQLNDLSASAFIVAFERFAANDCKVVDIPQCKQDGTRVTGYGEVSQAQAFAVIAHALGGRKRSETELRQAHDSIKYQFIRNHRQEIPTAEHREMKSAFGF